MPTRSALTPGSFLVLAGRFLLILFPLAVGSFVVFNVGVYGFSALAEYEQPGSLETPRNQNASVRSWYEPEAHQVYPKYMNEGDTYGIYQRDALVLVASVDLAGLGFYLRRRWKKRRALRTAVATQ